MKRVLIALVALSAALPAAADLFIVRHAEKKNPKMDQSLLSDVGFARAQTLKRVLSDVDLKSIYCTEYLRTQQTALPSATDHGLKPIITKAEDVKGLAAQLKARGTEDVLVVGHSDTIPELLVELGVSTHAAIAPDEFDNLFVVTQTSGAVPSYHRLRY